VLTREFPALAFRLTVVVTMMTALLPGARLEVVQFITCDLSSHDQPRGLTIDVTVVNESKVSVTVTPVAV